jgi:hypothetical protein
VAERVVADRGGTLLSIASLPLAQTDGFLANPRKARGTVVVDAGLNPGVTTLVLAEMLARHPEANRIRFGYTNRLSPRTSGGPKEPRKRGGFLSAPEEQRSLRLAQGRLDG